MGTDSLDDEEDAFYKDAAEVIVLVVKKDDTVNIKTSVTDMHELQSIFSTAIMMASFQHVKSIGNDIDKLH
jgi:hypothetical protein